jgi:hypothetical protein
MYFSEAGSATIKRADLDGSNVEVLVSAASVAGKIELDLIREKIYWSSGALLFRADFNGSNKEIIFTSTSIHGIAIDHDAEKLYFSARDVAVKSIRRSDLDGSNVETLIDNLPLTPIDIALDLDAGEIYWSRHNGVLRALIDDPTTIETLITVGGLASADGVNGLALDVTPVAEPGAALQLLSAACALAFLKRRKNRSRISNSSPIFAGFADK